LITRSPSNQKPFDLVWSRDSAFIQLADNASPEEREAHAAKWEIARESGDYSALKIDGADSPTVFTCKPLTHAQMTVIFDMSRTAGVGVGEVNALAFCCGLQSVVNLGDVDIKRAHHNKLGNIALTDFFEKAGVPAGMALNITLELGEYLIKKSSGLSGK
jgi:hypothetical protein